MDKEKAGLACWKIYENVKGEKMKEGYSVEMSGSGADIIDCFITLAENFLMQVLKVQRVPENEYIKFFACLACAACMKESHIDGVTLFPDFETLKEAANDGKDRE